MAHATSQIKHRLSGVGSRREPEPKQELCDCGVECKPHTPYTRQAALDPDFFCGG
jgi:hypothetical protein